MIRLRPQPEVEAQLAAEAREHGLPLERSIEKIVESRSSARQTEETERRKAVEAMMNFSKKHSTTLGGLDLKSMIHQGH